MGRWWWLWIGLRTCQTGRRWANRIPTAPHDWEKKPRRPKQIRGADKLPDGTHFLIAPRIPTNSKPSRRDQELRFTVHESPDYYNLKVSVFNDDKRTDLIGETWVSLEQVVIPGGGKGDKWHNLSCKGKYAGDIRIELTYYDTRVSPEKQTSDGIHGQTRIGSGPGGSPAMAGPRQPPPVRRRPLPADPNNSSPAGTPDRGTPISQPSFGPRGYHTPPHQRPLPASNSPSGFAIRDAPASSPMTFQQDHYQLSELPAEHIAQYDNRSSYGDEERMLDEYHDQRESSPYSLQYTDDGRNVHPTEGWSEPPSGNHQQQQHGHRNVPLPHSYSAPSVAAPTQGYHGTRHSVAEPYLESGRSYDHNREWSRDQRTSPLAPSMQPAVEDELSAPPPPPPPPAHRNSAPTLLNHRSTPNLNNSTDMRAYAAHRHRMSIAENSPQGSPMPPSPYGNQPPSHRASPHAHSPQASAYSTPTRTSRDMVSYNSPQSSLLAYQRPQYAPAETPSPGRSPRETQSTPNSVPLIKPQPISPSTQTSPMPAPLRQSGPPVSSRSTPTRKSVSPHPTPPGSGPGTTGAPFSPDSFDAFNPAVKGHSPVADSQQSYSPSSATNTYPRGGDFQPVKTYHRNEPIVTSTGHVVNPSDHLPADSWAPEPERKGLRAASEIGAEERASRPGPRGAQPMVTVRTKAGGATTMPMTVNRKPYTHPSHVSSALPAGMDTPAPLNPTPNPPLSAPVQQRETGPGHGGRNRLVKKSRPLSVGAPDIQNRGGPPTTLATTANAIPFAHSDNFAYPPQPSNYENLDYANPGYDDRSYGSGYRGAATATAPPVPAKIPLQPYVELEEDTYVADPEMQALSEEMKRIDIGPAPGMGARSGGRVRKSRFGA